MSGRNFLIGVLSIATLSVAACEQGSTSDTNVNEAPNADVPVSSYAIELTSHGKTFTVPCQNVQIIQATASRDRDDDSLRATCGSSFDGNTPALMEIVKGGRRIDKAVVSLGPQNANTYKVELRQAQLTGMEIGANSREVDVYETIDLSSAESRLIETSESGTKVAQAQNPKVRRDSHAMELTDHNKSFNLACDYLAIVATPPDDPDQESRDDRADYLRTTCQTSVDGNTPALMGLVKSGNRIDKVVVSLGQQNGHAFNMELRNVLLAYLTIAGDQTTPIASESLELSYSKKPNDRGTGVSPRAAGFARLRA